MARKIKDKYLGARVDEALETKVAIYIENAEGIDGMADLIRKAVEEYIANHPAIKLSQEV